MKSYKTEFLKLFRHRLLPYWNFFLEFILLVISFVYALYTEFTSSKMTLLLKIVFGLWGFALLSIFIKFICDRKTLKDYRKIQETEKYSIKMLEVLQRVNAYKTRHVLQITYGNVPKWHPFDYCNNVLVYDVHEQLRTTLLELKDALISVTPDLDPDSVTVNLVYCYPDDDYDGLLPTNKSSNEKWKLITSRDGSSTNYKVHDFLASKESFYFKLDQDNFIFFNDKTKENRYYINSGKDQEYGLKGSIVGLTLNVKNDVPEKVLVKAMLTITTYGRKLNEDSDPLEEKDYIDLFKKTVLNGYKSLLESELSQMYIRHMIREKRMCNQSGYIDNKTKQNNNNNNNTNNNNNNDEIACRLILSNNICAITGNQCNYAVDKKKTEDKPSENTTTS